MPPSMRCAYKCNKTATGEVNRYLSVYLYTRIYLSVYSSVYLYIYLSTAVYEVCLQMQQVSVYLDISIFLSIFYDNISIYPTDFLTSNQHADKALYRGTLLTITLCEPSKFVWLSGFLVSADH